MESYFLEGHPQDLVHPISNTGNQVSIAFKACFLFAPRFYNTVFNDISKQKIMSMLTVLQNMSDTGS